MSAQLNVRGPLDGPWPLESAKARKKLEKALETSMLDPWERYRALTDLVDRYLDTAELADRKSRFALLIVASLNALNAVAVLRPDLAGASLGGPWLHVYVACYAVVSLYLFGEAIRALRPRSRSAEQELEPAPGAGALTEMTAVTLQGPDDYYEMWRQARAGQLNRELALEAQHLARTNVAKLGAVQRLYNGVAVLVCLTAILLTGMAV